jgi:hypothetical protein
MNSKPLYQKLCAYVSKDIEGMPYHKHEAMVFSTPSAEQILRLYRDNEDTKFNPADMLSNFRLPYDKVAVEFVLRLDEYNKVPEQTLAFMSSITLDAINAESNSSQPTAITTEIFIGRDGVDAPKNGFFLGLGKLRGVFPTEGEYEELVKAHLIHQYGAQNVLTCNREYSSGTRAVFMVPSAISCDATVKAGREVKQADVHRYIEQGTWKVEEEIELATSYTWVALCLLDFLNHNRSGLKKHVVTPKLTVKDKMNRGKKRGARRYTHVYLDKVEYIKNDAPVMRTDVQAHMVRGHFKRKKNGIFWWNPFVRGRGKLNKREAYIVKESADERSPVVVQQDQSVREVPEAVLSRQGGEGVHRAGNGGHAVWHRVS